MAKKRVGIVGFTSMSVRLAQALGDYPKKARYDLRGFIVAEADHTSVRNLGYQSLGNLTDLGSVCVNEDLHVLAYDNLEHQVSERLFAELKSARVELVTIFELYERVSGRVMLASVSTGSPVPDLERRPKYELAKRVLDLLLALVMLLVALPMLGLIGLLVRLESQGPALYSQTTIGWNGRPFRMHRFRTMTADTGHLTSDSTQHRVTRIGRFLRSTTLDELPLLLSVLEGEMSLVGPQPELPWLVQRYESGWLGRFGARPGITGWAQINYTYRHPSPDFVTRMEYDLYYVKHRSLALDLKILLRAPIVALMGIAQEWPRTAPQFRQIWRQALSALLDDRSETFDQIVDQMTDYLARRLWFDVGRRKDELKYLHLRELNSGIAFESLRIPPTVPLVFLRSQVFLPAHLDDLRALLTRCYGTDSRFALLVVFFKGGSFRQISEELDERLRGVFAYEVVPVSQQDLQWVISSDRPSRALLKLIVAHVDILRLSPFVLTGPTPDNMFFGREGEIQLVVDRSRSTTYAIIGGRRIGKSSLLGRLHRIRLPAAGFCTLYHDCSTTPAYHTFLSASIRNWQPEAPPNAPLTFRDLIQHVSADKPLVLLLDEADKLVATDRASGWRLFNALRALVNSSHVQVVLSGERTLRDALRDPTSPLFNFANELLLGPMDYHAVEELVTRPMRQLQIELVDEKATVDRIWAFTSGHPNVIQRLCYRLIERLNEQGTRRVTLDDVNTVIKSPQFQEIDFLQTYWERATPLEQIISLLMAQEAKPYRLQAILDLLANQDLEPEPEIVKTALDRLVDLRSILKRSQAGYEFAVEAFPLVVANTTTAEDLLIVLKSQYLKNPMELVK